MAFVTYNPQNWRLSREIAARLAQSKNLAMWHWRLKNNLSQKQAAQKCGVYDYVWQGLENHRLIPTMDEAIKIEKTIHYPVHFLFPQIRTRFEKKLFVRTTSKLTFIRLVRGLTQKELAKMANVPVVFISEIERGFEANTNFMDLILRVVDALNSMSGYLPISEEDILGDVPDDFLINYDSLEEMVRSEIEALT